MATMEGTKKRFAPNLSPSLPTSTCCSQTKYYKQSVPGVLHEKNPRKPRHIVLEPFHSQHQQNSAKDNLKVIRTDPREKERTQLAAKDCVAVLRARGISWTGLNTHSLPKMITPLYITFYLITLSPAQQLNSTEQFVAFSHRLSVDYTGFSVGFAAN